jgi:hypothetical protein
MTSPPLRITSRSGRIETSLLVARSEKLLSTCAHRPDIPVQYSYQYKRVYDHCTLACRSGCGHACSHPESYVPDFSVVLFRSDCRLFSEKNRMKAHTNQWVLTVPYPLAHLAGATSRGQTMAPEGQKPSQWLYLTQLPREMCSQLIVHKALSRGTIRKAACILAEITIRKSQVPSF